jgi:hypothetical protein
MREDLNLVRVEIDGEVWPACLQGVDCADVVEVGVGEENAAGKKVSLFD